MNAMKAGPTLLLLACLGASPAAAQAIPDNIPDVPGESPADRAKERLEERYRGTLSRFFTGGSMDVAPITADGLSYGASASLGMRFRSGDAVYAFVSARDAAVGPVQVDGEEPLPGASHSVWYLGLGYQLRAMRFVEPSPLAQRGALNFGLGVMGDDEVSTLAVDISPTYDLLQRNGWSVPAGLKLSLAAVGDRDLFVTRAFVGLTLGIQRHFGRRDRLESK